MRLKITFNSLLMATAFMIMSVAADAQFWLPVGSGVNDNAYAFTKDTVNDVLYVGGRFTDAGGNQAYRIAKWDGSTWTALGDGFDSDVYALYFDHINNTLYAGGNFNFSGINPINYIAKWDGSNWLPLGTGCNDQVLSLTDSVGNSRWIFYQCGWCKCRAYCQMEWKHMECIRCRNWFRFQLC